jgi:eukaryotic-like serine/threonine-protein kinase
VTPPLPLTAVGENAAISATYQVLGSLGRGGMAEVFVVQSRRAGQFARRCALKRILPELSGDPRYEDMFAAEAQLGALLCHPNIVMSYDTGVDSEGRYLVMEYIDGLSCASLLRIMSQQERHIPTGCSLYIAEAVGRALHYAHELCDREGRRLELVHRDVSPSNVLLGHLGEVKLADFGVARTPLLTISTVAGDVKGKLAYMSPEQAEGRSVDHRSDVFGLGILLYELLTGQRLFGEIDESPARGIRKLTEALVDAPSAVRAGIPPDIDNIVLRALRRDPMERYPSASAIADDLRLAVRRHGFAADTRTVQEVVASVRGSAIQPAPLHVADDASIEITPSRRRASSTLAAQTYPPLTSGRRQRPRLFWGVLGVGVVALLLQLGEPASSSRGKTLPLTKAATPTPPPLAPDAHSLPDGPEATNSTEPMPSEGPALPKSTAKPRNRRRSSHRPDASVPVASPPTSSRAASDEPPIAVPPTRDPDALERSWNE